MAPGDALGRDTRQEHLLWVLSAATFLIFFQAYMVAPLIPKLSEVFAAPAQSMGLIVPAYLIPYGVSTLIYGLLSDRIGRRRIMVASLTAFVVLTALGYDMTQPLLAGIVTALGGRRGGQAMGLNVFTLFTGFGLGSLLFGAALDLGFAWALALFASLQLGAALAAVPLFRTEVHGTAAATAGRHRRLIPRLIRAMPHRSGEPLMVRRAANSQSLFPSNASQRVEFQPERSTNRRLRGGVMDQYEVIVVGAGPPGLTAGLYCGGAQLKTLILGNVRVRRARERREGGTRNREKRSRGKVKART